MEASAHSSLHKCAHHAGAGQVGSRIAEGPRQIQAILVRMQARMEEQRLQASLQAERDSPVDVQVSNPATCPPIYLLCGSTAAMPLDIQSTKGVEAQARETILQDDAVSGRVP